MGESMKCPYEDKCKEVYPDEKMDERRKECDCISCAFCDEYWKFYDKKYLEKYNSWK